MRCRLVVLVCLALLPACTSYRTAPERSSGSQGVSSFGKTDLDRVTEATQQEIFINLRSLTEKLYRRNPRELKKSGQPSIEAALTRIFERHHGWGFEDLNLARGTDAIHLAFRE